MAELKADGGDPYRAFVCQTINPWGFPAKDRSGRLAQSRRTPSRPPDGEDPDASAPATDRLTYRPAARRSGGADQSQPQS